MRVALLLLCLAGCQAIPARTDIPALLAGDPIDIDRLEGALAIPPGALRIHPPKIPAVSFRPTPGPWKIENTSDSSIWLKRSALEIRVRFMHFLPRRELRGGRLGGKRTLIPGKRPPRPVFDPAEWVLLAPGETLDLHSDPEKEAAAVGEYWLYRFKHKDAEIPGIYRSTLTIYRNGKHLAWKARHFNAWKELKRPRGIFDPVLRSSLEELVLPGFDSPEYPWHGTYAITPSPIKGRLLEFIAEQKAWDDKPWPLPMEAFILEGRGRIVYQGALKIKRVEGTLLAPAGNGGMGRVRTRTVYTLPDWIPPGSYRMLVRSADAHSFFSPGKHMCDAPSGAASRWIQVSIVE